MNKKICLDPGHYGMKYNAGVISGYYESATVWKLTQYEKEYLEKMGIEVVLTRKNPDENPELTERGRMAVGCDLFCSNHTNACETPSVDRAVVIHMVEHAETDADDRSMQFAMRLAKVIQDTMGLTGCEIYSRISGNDRDGNGKKDDNYYGVLHGSFLANVPGVIAEHSFHTNKAACEWLLNDENLRKLAKACAECMAAFVGFSITEDKGQIEETSAEVWYRVRTEWENVRSQIGAYHNLEFAKEQADKYPGYGVYDEAGIKIYPANSYESYMVRVKIGDLNMRLGASVDTVSIGYIEPGVYTIVEERAGKVNKAGKSGVWGRLKSEQMYHGKSVSVWICLSYTDKIQ